MRFLVPASLAAFLVLMVASTGCEKKTKSNDAPPAGSLGASAFPPTAVAARSIDAGVKSEKVEVPEIRVKPDAPTTVRVTWLTPSGTTVNDEAPFRVQWNRSDGLQEAPADVRSTGSQIKNGFRVQVRPMAGAPNATLGGEINIVVCDDVTHSVCVPVRRTVELGFVATKDAESETTVSIPLPAAK